MADLARQAGLSESAGGGAKDKAERDARFVGDFTDDLTVAIALREFERAVQLVEEGIHFVVLVRSCFIFILFQVRSKWDQFQPSLLS
jgi:hypothetical protein